MKRTTRSSTTSSSVGPFGNRRRTRAAAPEPMPVNQPPRWNDRGQPQPQKLTHGWSRGGSPSPPPVRPLTSHPSPPGPRPQGIGTCSRLCRQTSRHGVLDHQSHAALRIGSWTDPHRDRRPGRLSPASLRARARSAMRLFLLAESDMPQRLAWRRRSPWPQPNSISSRQSQWTCLNCHVRICYRVSNLASSYRSTILNGPGSSPAARRGCVPLRLKPQLTEASRSRI